MDLGQVYREQFQTNFVHFGTARFEVVYTSIGQDILNRTTGVVTTPDDVVLPSFKMVKDKEMLAKIPGVTIDEDETGVIFPALDMVDSEDDLVEPAIDDHYNDLDGNAWIVSGVYPDNFKAMWLLKVRGYVRG